MWTKQATTQDNMSTSHLSLPAADQESGLILVFGSVERFSEPGFGRTMRTAYPDTPIVGCTTAGEITRTGVADGSLAVTAIGFDTTRVRTHSLPVPTMSESGKVGAALGAALAAPDLRYVLVLSDGIQVNGTALVGGLRKRLGRNIPISGGLAGDGGRFERTLLLHDSTVESRVVIAAGFYGDSLQVRHGCVGGWTVFGPRRKVTKVEDNVVYTLDDRPILQMYEQYLGDEAQDLPASGLLYPLAMLSQEREETGIIRTLLGIDREEGSITFAGDIEQGTVVQLMYAEDDELIEGAASAATQCHMVPRTPQGALALMVSCVGRKLLLGHKTSREVQAAVAQLGDDFTYAGFYSNGEISPFPPTGRCELHNETMTITTMVEDAD